MNGLNPIVVAITVAVVCILRSHAIVDYSDLVALDAACPGRDNCLLIGSANFTQRNCECDRLCSVFDDCCINASNSRKSENNRSSRLNCMAFGQEANVGVYAMDHCPSNYAGSPTVRNKCEAQDDFYDPLISVPVTEPSNGITYRNRYCAECNSADPNSLQSWLIFLNCESLAPYNLNDSFVWQNIKYDSRLNSWGMAFRGNFYTCDLVFDKPAYISSGIRLCRANVVSGCPQNWRRRSVERICESYTAVVYTRTDVVYKNAHCALCNGESISNLYCDRDGLFFRRKKPFSFALLLDVNTSDGDIVGETRACSSGEKYDPFFKKCRKLVCALPGYTMVNGKCKKG